MEIFKLFGSIFVNTDAADQSMKKTEKGAESIATKLGNGIKVAAKWGAAFTAAAAAGATAMGALTTKALNAAGELEQNMGGSEAVFGEYAEKMQKTAKNAFKNMGVSASDFLASANKMGALFQGAGFNIDESAELSANAMQRAADVASIMGISLESAMESVTGAAKGNFTMMDNLGVAINDTTLQAYALSKGIDKATKDMTTQEKVGLAMELFMEKTAYAAGNYAKENETLAGSLNTAKAAMSNFLSGAGTAGDLVNAFVGAGKVIIDNLKDILPRLVSGLQELTMELIPYLPEMIQSILPGIIEGTVALLGGLVQALPSLLEAVFEVARSLFEQLIPSDVLEFWGEVLQPAFSEVGKALAFVAEMFAPVIQSFTDMLPKADEAVTLFDLFREVCWAIEEALLWVAENLLVFGVWVDENRELVEMMTVIIGSFAAAFVLVNGALTVFSTVATVASTVGGVLGGVLAFLTSPIGLVVVAIGALIAIGVALYKNWDTVKAKCNELWTNVTQKFNSLKESVVGKVTEIKTNVLNKFNEIKDGIAQKIEAARDKVKGAIDKIKGFFNFSWSLPKLKMPHPKISGSFSLNPPSVPSFSIDWYAKAMNDPIIMNSPTAFGINSLGQIMAGGERGSEVVSGTDTLMRMIAQAVASQNETLLRVLLDILDAITRMDRNMGENVRDGLMGMGIDVNNREFARLVKAVI